MLPLAVGQYLLESCPEELSSLPSKKLKLINALLPPEAPPLPLNHGEENGDEEVVGVTEETKQRVTRLYHKGIRVSYLAELFSVESGRLIHSWGNWAKRPTAEAEKNTTRRNQVQTLLAQGETPKAICQELKMKPKIYRELLGLPTMTVYSRAVYERAMQQMQDVKIKNTVSRSTGISVYILNKWLEGKDIPDADAISDDEFGSRESKKLAIELFYETGSSAAAALALKTTSAQVKKWVMDFQRTVDTKSSGSQITP